MAECDKGHQGRVRLSYERGGIPNRVSCIGFYVVYVSGKGWMLKC